MKVIVDYTIENEPINEKCEIIINKCKMVVVLDHVRNGKCLSDKTFLKNAGKNAGKNTHEFKDIEKNDIIQF